MKKKNRVLVLIDYRLIPPEKIESQLQLDNAPWRAEYYVIKALKSLGHDVHVLGVNGDLRVIKEAQEQFKPHIAFNLLEEFNGETVFDHNVVSYLELIGLRYTGCNPKGLILGRDKSLSKKILNYHRIKTPQFAVAKKGKKFKRAKKMTFPLIVKSLTEEGSVGISQSSVVSDDQKLQERIAFIHEHTVSDAIVESYIEGTDIYASVIGNRQLTVCPILELVFKNAPDNFHQIATSKVKWSEEYRKKYKIDVKVLSGVEEKNYNKIVAKVRKIYKVLCFNGYARLDLRLTSDGNVYFIEGNPNPDISNHEEFAISAAKVGLSYNKLIDKLLRLGSNWGPEDIYN